MKTYGYINNGVLQEIIASMVYDAEHPDWVEGSPSRVGTEVPIEDRFTSEFIESCVDVTDVRPIPKLGWTYADGVFAKPVPYVPTPAEVLAQNTATRDQLLTTAALAIAPLQDAVDLDEATPAEVAALKAWKQYRVAVNRIDLMAVSPAWPTAPGAA